MSPPETSTDDQVRCPHCAATFTLGNAVEVSLPKLIRIQQQRQDENTFIHDTAQTVPWALWADLTIDETSLDGKPVEESHEHLTRHEVHDIKSEPTDDESFQTTASPTSESSIHDADPFSFVIEGEEASKIFSKQELELAEQEAAKEDSSTFDLGFDESLLEDEQTDGNQEVDMFDFEAEAGELEPSEFDIPSQRKSRPQTDPSIPRPSSENRDQVAVAFSRIGHGKRPSQARQALILGTSGMFLLFVLYYSLNYFGGSQFDLLGLYLPGCPHTYGQTEEVTDPLKPDPSSPYERSNLDKSLTEMQQTPNSPGNVKPSLREVTAYRPIEGNPPTENNHDNPAIDPTPASNGTAPKSNHGLYNADLFVPRLTIDRSREEFQLPEGDAGLVAHPLFDVRELEASLEATHEQFGCPQCQSTGYLTSPDGSKIKCDCCLGDPPNIMDLRGYRYFCQLGQVVSLLKDDSERALEAKHQVNELLKKTVKSEREYQDLARILNAKLENPLHNTEGIMITGLVRVVRPHNGLYGAIIGIPDSDQRITVISDRPFDFIAEDRVVLLGIVIQEPAKNIAGFEANQKSWVIWHGASVTIPETFPETITKNSLHE